MKITTIDLIRHGLPELGSLYRGHTIDDPLSELGWQQMWETVGDARCWDMIVSSPMLRCSAFAEALAQRNGCQLNIDDRLKEVGFGAWEGRTREQIKQDDLQAYQQFYADPVNDRPAGAEPLSDFTSRVVNAYQESVEKFAGKHVLIVAHAGVIRAIIAHTLYSQPIGLYKIKIDNGKMSRIEYGSNGGILVSHNQ